MTDADYLCEAYRCAQESKDRSTMNGAVLVDPWSGKILVSGWNDIHPPLHDSDERRTKRPEKYWFTEHAERDVILKASRKGIATEGLWLYCPWAACADCGRAIVRAGIAKVITHDIPQHYSRPDWAPSIEAANQMFAEAGVVVVRVKAHLGVKFRFDGQEIEV